MERLQIFNHRKKRILLIGGVTIVVFVVLELTGVLGNVQTNKADSSTESLNSLWYIISMILLLGILAWLYLTNFTRKSLVSVKAQFRNNNLEVQVVNVSDKKCVFSFFELEYVPENGSSRKKKRLHLTSSVEIPKNKRWSSSIPVKSLLLENNVHWPVKWVKIELIDEDSAHYSSNKIVLK